MPTLAGHRRPAGDRHSMSIPPATSPKIESLGPGRLPDHRRAPVRPVPDASCRDVEFQSRRPTTFGAEHRRAAVASSVPHVDQVYASWRITPLREPRPPCLSSHILSRRVRSLSRHGVTPPPTASGNMCMPRSHFGLEGSARDECSSPTAGPPRGRCPAPAPAVYSGRSTDSTTTGGRLISTVGSVELAAPC